MKKHNERTQMDRLIVCTTLILTASGAMAADITDALNRCRAIEDENERLACFDRAAGSVGKEPETTPPTVAEPAAVQPGPVETTAPAAAESSAAAPEPEPTAEVAPVTEEEFGLELLREQKGVQKIASRYDGRFTGWDGDTLFPLENGQVWKQIESGRYSYKADRPMIEIKRGLFQSYYLKVQGQNRTVRVTRIR